MDNNENPRKPTSSILHEISTFIPSRNQEDVMEMRGNHAVTAMINLLETIDGYYTEEEAEILNKRIMSAIRTRDIKKFERGIRKINEERNARK